MPETGEVTTGVQETGEVTEYQRLPKDYGRPQLEYSTFQ